MPRNAGRIPDHRGAETAIDVDARQAAGPLIDVDAGNSDGGGCRGSVVAVQRIVVIVSDAYPELTDQSRREDPVVVDAHAVGLLDAGALERALRPTAGQAEDRRLIGHRAAVAETRTETPFVRRVVVHFDVEGIRVLRIRQQREIVVAWGRFARRLVRARHQVHDLLGNRADPVGGDDVPRERQPARAVGVSGRRVIHHHGRCQRKTRAQVAGAPAAGRNRAQVGVGLVIRGSQKIAEDEDLVFLDRSAYVAAEIVIGEVSDRRVEEVARIQRTIAQKLVSGAVEFVGPGFQNHIGVGSARAAQGRFVVAGRNIHRLNRFEWRHHDLQQTGALIVIDAFDLIAVAHAHLTIDFGLQRTGGVEELGVLETRARGAGYEVQQRLIVAIRAQRQRGRLHYFQLRSGIGAIRLQQGRRTGNFHGLRNAARRHLDIDARAGVDRERNVFAVFLLEALQFNRNRVLAGRQIRERIITAFVGLTGSCDSGVDFRDGHLCARYYTAAAVRDGAEKGRVDCLGIRTNGSQSEQRGHSADLT